MSGTTAEKQKNLEKTPAEIASELEKKATLLDVEGKQVEAKRKRELAKKVREVESSTVTGTTELKLEALQAKLPALEKKDLEEARTISPVEVAIWTAGLATVIDQLDGSMEKTGLGKLGIKESIKEWFNETLTEELPQDANFFDKLIHNIKMFFLTPFAKMFGVDMKKKGEKDEKDKDKKEELQKKNEHKTEAKEIMEDALFNKVAKSLVKFNPDKKVTEKIENENAPSVLSSIKNKTFTQIHTIYTANKGNNKSLVIGLWLKDTNPRTAEIAVTSLIHSETLLDSFFKKIDWKNMPLVNVLESVWPEFKQLMDIEALETEEDVKKFITEMSNPLGKWGQMEVWMKAKYDALQKRFTGMTPGVLTSIFSLDGLNDKGITDDFLDANFKEPKEKEFIKETLLPFRDKFLAMLDSPRVNGWESVRKYFEWKNPIKMSELLMIFIKTGGHMNFEEMNTMEQVSLYQSIFSLLMKRDEWEAAGYMTRLVNSSSSDIPPEAQKILSAIGDKGKDLLLKTIAATFNISVGVFENLTPAQKAWVIAAGAIFVFAGRFIFWLKVFIIAAWLAAFVGSSAIAAILGESKK